MRSSVNLFYLSPNTTGGWVTFTAHLMEGMRRAGVEPRLFRIGAFTRDRLRDFGYGEKYQQLERFDAMVKVAEEDAYSLIVAIGKKYKENADDLYHMGAKVVVHDPTEYKNLPEFLRPTDCIVPRPSGTIYEEGARHILHPYAPIDLNPDINREKLCVTTSRIDFDKRTHILLDANRMLPVGKDIDIRGFENRIYTRFKLVPEYPEWVQSIWNYPRTREAAFELLQTAFWTADMSVIKGDGGGTQYTTLESWNARTAMIINDDWLKPGGEMQHGVNCHAVGDGEELAEFLDSYGTLASHEYRKELVEVGLLSLQAHDAKDIAEQYLEFLHESYQGSKRA